MVNPAFYITAEVEPAYAEALTFDFTPVHEAVATEPDTYAEAGPLAISFVYGTPRGQLARTYEPPGRATVNIAHTLDGYRTPDEVGAHLSQAVLQRVGYHINPQRSVLEANDSHWYLAGSGLATLGSVATLLASRVVVEYGPTVSNVSLVTGTALAGLAGAAAMIRGRRLFNKREAVDVHEFPEEFAKRHRGLPIVTFDPDAVHGME